MMTEQTLSAALLDWSACSKNRTILTNRSLVRCFRVLDAPRGLAHPLAKQIRRHIREIAANVV